MSRERPHEQLPDDPSLSTLYQATRREQPSAGLDKAVIEEARRALSRRRLRWWLPLSTAAVILLGVSLTLNQIEPPAVTAPSDEMLDEGPPPSAASSAPMPGLREKALKSQPAPSLQRAAPARRESSVEDRFLDTPLQSEMQALPATEADMAKRVLAPEQRVAQMLELLRQKDAEALRQALKAFRELYPDYPLPEELEAVEDSTR